MIVPAMPDSAAVGSCGLSEELYAKLCAKTPAISLTGPRLATAQAMRLLWRLDAELFWALTDANQDRFRRLLRARHNAVRRLKRRWTKLASPPAVPLGDLRRPHRSLGISNQKLAFRNRGP